MRRGSKYTHLLQLVELGFEACQQILISTAALQNSHILLDQRQVELLIQTAESSITNSPKLNLCNQGTRDEHASELLLKEAAVSVQTQLNMTAQ